MLFSVEHRLLLQMKRQTWMATHTLTLSPKAKIAICADPCLTLQEKAFFNFDTERSSKKGCRGGEEELCQVHNPVKIAFPKIL